MARLELEIGDARLEALAIQAYYQRQTASLDQWKAKLAESLAIAPETVSPAEAARLKAEVSFCQREIAVIEGELKDVQQKVEGNVLNPQTGKVWTIGEIRQARKRPSPNLNRNKKVW